MGLTVLRPGDQAAEQLTQVGEGIGQQKNPHQDQKGSSNLGNYPDVPGGLPEGA
jgi:hypothetical protein